MTVLLLKSDTSQRMATAAAAVAAVAAGDVQQRLLSKLVSMAAQSNEANHFGGALGGLAQPGASFKSSLTEAGIPSQAVLLCLRVISADTFGGYHNVVI